MRLMTGRPLFMSPYRQHLCFVSGVQLGGASEPPTAAALAASAAAQQGRTLLQYSAQC